MNRVFFLRGCRGDIVSTIQRGLADSGYYTGKLDGLYGGGTEAAVTALQRDRDLPTSGQVDEPT